MRTISSLEVYKQCYVFGDVHVSSLFQDSLGELYELPLPLSDDTNVPIPSPVRDLNAAPLDIHAVSPMTSLVIPTTFMALKQGIFYF